MADYVYVLRLADPWQSPSEEVLATTMLALHPIVIVEPSPMEWIAGCTADDDADARRQVESKITDLPAFVPELEIVALREI